MTQASLLRPNSAANMPRPRHGWKDKATGRTKGTMWQVRHDGRYVNLTPYGAPTTVSGKNGSKAERNAALAARDRFLATLDRKAHAEWLEAQRPGAGIVTVADAINGYIANHLRKVASHRTNAPLLLDFINGRAAKNGVLAFVGVGEIPYANLSQQHVAKFVAAHPNWTPSGGERSFITALRAACSWAVKAKLVDHNPLAHLKPAESKARSVYFTAADEQLWRKHCRNDALLEFVSAGFDLGTRPSELARLTTDHVRRDAQGNIFWQLDAHEHKTGRKSKKPRKILLVPKWVAHTHTMLAKAKQLGKPVFLFVNNSGGKWRNRVIDTCFRRVCERVLKHEKLTQEQRHKFGEAADSADKLHSYSTRHSFITRKLLAGVSAFTVASLCGTSEGEIRRVYSHLLDDHTAMLSVLMAG